MTEQAADDRASRAILERSGAISVSIPGEPRAKQRPRFGRGRAYRKDRGDEDAVGWALRTAIREPFEGDVFVWMWFFRSTRRRFDLDNAIKLVLDAGNKIAYRDDMQVKRLEAELLCDPSNPRTLIMIGPIWSAEEVPA